MVYDSQQQNNNLWGKSACANAIVLLDVIELSIDPELRCKDYFDFAIYE